MEGEKQQSILEDCWEVNRINMGGLKAARNTEWHLWAKGQRVWNMGAIFSRSWKGSLSHFAMAVFHHSRYPSWLQCSSQTVLWRCCSWAVLGGSSFLCRAMKSSDQLHFSKVSNLMETVQVSFCSLGRGTSAVGWFEEWDFSWVLIIAATELATVKFAVQPCQAWPAWRKELKLLIWQFFEPDTQDFLKL